MASITKQCAVSGKGFVITDEDQAFYKKVEVPEPTLCPEERRRRRLAIRNETSLYSGTCAKTGKSMISMYSPDSPYTIYDRDEWWKNDWDPLEYGQEFDFSRPFFEQFEELQLKVPRMALVGLHNENSTFISYSAHNKDSYLIYTADYNEKCYYMRFSDRNYSCLDADFTYDSRFCLNVFHAINCETCFYSYKIKGSSGLYFCYNMQSCHDCMFSANLQNQQYVIFNKKVSKEEYEKMKANMGLDTQAGMGKAKKYFEEHIQKFPRKNLENMRCEDSTGDYLEGCKDTHESFNCEGLRDVKFATHLHQTTDAYDWDFIGYKCQLCYEMCSSCYNLRNCRFCMNIWEGADNLTYTDLCIDNKDLFGCVGLRKKEYCILNKQYTKEQYEELVPKIIEHMKSTGEWGEFFPVSISPYGYNETVAQEYFPLTKEEALTRGYKWKDKDDSAAYQGPEVTLPEAVADADESVCDKVLQCAESSDFYKIIPQELKFYKRFGIALPRIAPMERHGERMKLRNPRKLWDRTCGKCAASIKSSYAPERPEPVYCEDCYLKEVF
ncbi:hypothetical protein HN748_00100 [Candidatus Peregrinibacteria bacterium]|jgi:hypothetical protein|nr:hypothetical protein [Candidatus Peregrinibacteria bacterium]MBT7484046.1 hypothetical protein [Candidatus Peregrinibacteria bacterium]MBT7702613.1 hypothetical protein [Candidatus Peregrinibacteria bacterium]